MISTALPTLTSISTAQDTPPNLDISSSSAEQLHSLLQGEVQRLRALVDLHNFSTPAANGSTTPALPLVERLSQYPANVDLTNVVSYPPKLESIPVKPLFFDVAWNYIDYDGQEKPAVAETTPVVAEEAQESPAPQKKGWFGFGR
jgi:signal recognition particle subunit SRP68